MYVDYKIVIDGLSNGSCNCWLRTGLVSGLRRGLDTCTLVIICCSSFILSYFVIDYVNVIVGVYVNVLCLCYSLSNCYTGL